MALGRILGSRRFSWPNHLLSFLCLKYMRMFARETNVNHNTSISFLFLKAAGHVLHNFLTYQLTSHHAQALLGLVQQTQTCQWLSIGFCCLYSREDSCRPVHSLTTLNNLRGLRLRELSPTLGRSMVFRQNAYRRFALM